LTSPQHWFLMVTRAARSAKPSASLARCAQSRERARTEPSLVSTGGVLVSVAVIAVALVLGCKPHLPAVTRAVAPSVAPIASSVAPIASPVGSVASPISPVASPAPVAPIASPTDRQHEWLARAGDGAVLLVVRPELYRKGDLAAHLASSLLPWSNVGTEIANTKLHPARVHGLDDSRPWLLSLFDARSRSYGALLRDHFAHEPIGLGFRMLIPSLHPAATLRDIEALALLADKFHSGDPHLLPSSAAIRIFTDAYRFALFAERDAVRVEFYASREADPEFMRAPAAPALLFETPALRSLMTHDADPVRVYARLPRLREAALALDLRSASAELEYVDPTAAWNEAILAAVSAGRGYFMLDPRFSEFDDVALAFPVRGPVSSVASLTPHGQSLWSPVFGPPGSGPRRAERELQRGSELDPSVARLLQLSPLADEWSHQLVSIKDERCVVARVGRLASAPLTLGALAQRASNGPDQSGLKDLITGLVRELPAVGAEAATLDLGVRFDPLARMVKDDELKGLLEWLGPTQARLTLAESALSGTWLRGPAASAVAPSTTKWDGPAWGSASAPPPTLEPACLEAANHSFADALGRFRGAELITHLRTAAQQALACQAQPLASPSEADALGIAADLIAAGIAVTGGDRATADAARRDACARGHAGSCRRANAEAAWASFPVPKLGIACESPLLAPSVIQLRTHVAPSRTSGDWGTEAVMAEPDVTLGAVIDALHEFGNPGGFLAVFDGASGRFGAHVLTTGLSPGGREVVRLAALMDIGSRRDSRYRRWDVVIGSDGRARVTGVGAPPNPVTRTELQAFAAPNEVADYVLHGRKTAWRDVAAWLEVLAGCAEGGRRVWISGTAAADQEPARAGNRPH
jgi:hypothetical protein